MDCKGYPPRLTAELEAIHREQFGGAHQVLFLMDSMEGEEYFYLHKGNRLQPKNGFYIYYARELHEIRIPDVTIELPRRGTRQMLPEILTESKKENEKEECSSSKSERKPTSYAMAAAIALLFGSDRGRNLAAANSYSGSGTDGGDDRGKKSAMCHNRQKSWWELKKYSGRTDGERKEYGNHQ